MTTATTGHNTGTVPGRLIREGIYCCRDECVCLRAVRHVTWYQTSELSGWITVTFTRKFSPNVTPWFPINFTTRHSRELVLWIGNCKVSILFLNHWIQTTQIRSLGNVWLFFPHCSYMFSYLLKTPIYAVESQCVKSTSKSRFWSAFTIVTCMLFLYMISKRIRLESAPYLSVYHLYVPAMNH